MNYTQNHHLPQWVKSDRIMMDDFNQMCKDIESGMTANAQAAANAQSAANTAQSTANSAQSTANTARQEAAVLPYAVGTYTGTGENITINVGFRPSFLIVSGLPGGVDMTKLTYFHTCCCATAGGGSMAGHVQFTGTGFQIIRNGNLLPRLSESGRVYEYIAFK